MHPPLDTVRVSQRGKELLLKLKRRTGIENWNVLCRWALSSSLSDQNTPITQERYQDSNIEMKWNVFAGDLSDALLAVFYLRLQEEQNFDRKEDQVSYFRAHLERGIMQISNHKKLGAMLAIAT